MAFEGITYRTAKNWIRYIPDTRNTPIKYLEIGAFYGANVLSVADTYAAHPDSQLHCVDPWIDYSEYPEYKNQQETIYETFCRNIANSPSRHKIFTHRGFSHLEVQTFEDETFDLIYIDGNHEPEFVLEDAVLCFRKLKKGGYMIFDDYGWCGPDMTKRGIDAFLNGYYKRLAYIGTKESQVFIQKK
jgi:SAM-dependent methyltransferase